MVQNVVDDYCKPLWNREVKGGRQVANSGYYIYFNNIRLANLGNYPWYEIGIAPASNLWYAINQLNRKRDDYITQSQRSALLDKYDVTEQFQRDVFEDFYNLIISQGRLIRTSERRYKEI